MNDKLDHEQIALGIKQPWAELILRGVKTLEIRSRPTNVRGPIYLYTSKVVAREAFAREAIEQYELANDRFIKGKLVGSIDIVDCRTCEPDDDKNSGVPWHVMQNKFAWELANPVRFDEPVDVRFLPYGVWFYPFKRRQKS